MAVRSVSLVGWMVICELLDPCDCLTGWIPACAGMTGRGRERQVGRWSNGRGVGLTDWGLESGWVWAWLGFGG